MIDALRRVNHILAEHHYLGATRRGIAWSDEYGVIVLASPTGRRLPTEWLEISRWCIVSGATNAGTRQWGGLLGWLRAWSGSPTTVVSYSDPAVGHDGALYRACGWAWAPTWHRLRPPPSGNGNWGSGPQSVKDRWVFPLRPDSAREGCLAVRDTTLRRRFPWAEYREPRIKRGRIVQGSGGGDWRRYHALREVEAP